MIFSGVVERLGPRLVLSLVLMLSVFAGSAAQAASFQTLEIVTKSGVQVFSVEMATTGRRRQPA
jgi:hypothetical protein